MVTREEIRWGYLMLFGREPECEDAYRAHAVQPDVATLRRTLIRSPEGLARLRADMRVAASSYDFDYFRPLLVFVHMEKTGGTSVYDVLARHHGAAESSPPHLAFLPELPLGELNRYDFVSGHFSYQEAMALPRSNKRCITMFREPFARLISFYRFHRAHPLDPDGDPITVLAHELGPAAFFRHRTVRRSHRTDNVYLRTFGPIRRPRTALAGKAAAAALDLAIKRIGSLDALGLTEDMAGSMRLIGAGLGIGVPTDIPKLHVTDRFHAATTGFAPAEAVASSDELRAAMLPLVRHDLVLYAHARQLFARRLAALDGDVPRTDTGPTPSPDTRLKRWMRRVRS